MREGHKYDANDNQYLDSVWSSDEFRSGTVDATHQLFNSSLCDTDVDPDAPICIGMDYNANINWIVAYDIKGYLMLLINNSIWVVVG